MSQSSSSAEPQQLVHVSGAQLCMCGGGSGDVLPWKMPLDCLDRVASRACVHELRGMVAKKESFKLAITPSLGQKGEHRNAQLLLQINSSRRRTVEEWPRWWSQRT